MPFCCQQCFRRCWKEHKTFHDLKAEISASPTSQSHIQVGLVLSGNSYVGEMLKGVSILEGDAKETSKFIKKSIDGRGTFRFLSSGFKIDGHFRLGTPVAYSKLTVTELSGEVYSGEYDEYGRPHGHGMRLYSNGDYFIGEWNHSKRVRGAMYDADGLTVRDGECCPTGFMTAGVIRKRERVTIKGHKVLMPYNVKVNNVVFDEEFEYQMHTTQDAGIIAGPVLFKFANGDTFSCDFAMGFFDPTKPHEYRDSDGIVREGYLPPQVDPDMCQHKLHPFPEGWEEEDGLHCLIVHLAKYEAAVERQRDGTSRSYVGISKNHAVVVDI